MTAADAKIAAGMARSIIERIDAAEAALYRPQREHHLAAAAGIAQALREMATEEVRDEAA